MKHGGSVRALAAAGLAGALALPRALAQTEKALRRVGVLRIGRRVGGDRTLQELSDGFRQHGFAHGRDIVLEVLPKDSAALNPSDPGTRSQALVELIQGAKPAEVPVEQSTRFELVIDLKTAKAPDITVPRSLLVSTDEAIA